MSQDSSVAGFVQDAESSARKVAEKIKEMGLDDQISVTRDTLWVNFRRVDGAELRLYPLHAEWFVSAQVKKQMSGEEFWAKLREFVIVQHKRELGESNSGSYWLKGAALASGIAAIGAVFLVAVKL